MGYLLQLASANCLCKDSEFPALATFFFADCYHNANVPFVKEGFYDYTFTSASFVAIGLILAKYMISENKINVVV